MYNNYMNVSKISQSPYIKNWAKDSSTWGENRTVIFDIWLSSTCKTESYLKVFPLTSHPMTSHSMHFPDDS